MSNPTFTFCIPNLNKIQYLPVCIESMLAQECEDWKCVFVDGYSTDGSWEYMQQFAFNPRFLLLRGLKQGMYADWNECLRHVDTEYLYFLTSDDTCYPTLVSKTITALDAYPEVDVCHFQFALIDDNGAIFRTSEEITQLDFELYVDVNKYPHRRSGLCEFFMHFVYRTVYRTITSLVFRRSLIPKMGGFSSLYGTVGDYDWGMRLGLFSDILYIPELLATWRVYEGQATQNLDSPLNRERRLKIAKSNFDLFIEMSGLYDLKKIPKKQIILQDFYDGCASSLLKKSNYQNSFELLKNLSTLARNYPYYPLRKIITRLSQGRLYKYQSYNIEFAQRLIEEYHLAWPPAPIDI